MYLDMFGNSNGGLTVSDLETGVSKLIEWKEDFLYNLDEIVFLLDNDEDGNITFEELELVLPGLCEYWKEKAGIVDEPEEEVAEDVEEAEAEDDE